MNATNMVGIGKKIGNELIKRSPVILTGIGAVGVVVTSGLTVRSTLKAVQILDEAGYETRILGEYKKKEQRMDIFMKAFPAYIPPIVAGVVSIGCIIGGMILKDKQYAALLAVYAATNDRLNRYIKSIEENLSNEDRGKVQETVALAQVRDESGNVVEIVHEGDAPITDIGNEHVENSNEYTTLCFDSVTGRFFNSNITAIRQAELQVNKNLFRDAWGCVSLNELCDLLNISTSSLGEHIGWTTEHPLELRVSYGRSEANGAPILGIDYNFDFIS